MTHEAQTSSAGPAPRLAADFNRQPFVLAWELTRACNLACVHCRASAQYRPHPLELSTEEALAFIDEVAKFDIPPTLILTGGDPMRRRDLNDLITHATAHGIKTALTPAGTPLASKRRLAEAQQAGLGRVAVSFDGPTAEIHDAFRRVEGSFKWTWAITEAVHELGIPLQVHTTLCRRTVQYLPEMADLADQLGAAVWAVFCLVPVGRAQFDDELTAEEYETAFHWLAECSKTAGWRLKLTEGYHYRRVLAERSEQPIPGARPGGGNAGRAPAPVNAGNGFCFVSHIGEICPSGFLPIKTGNVRRDSIVDVYQTHPVFRSLRDPDQLHGTCGGCRFKTVCGGSRSRAYAHSGDYLSSDPACAYQPEAARGTALTPA